MKTPFLLILNALGPSIRLVPMELLTAFLDMARRTDAFSNGLPYLWNIHNFPICGRNRL